MIRNLLILSLILSLTGCYKAHHNYILKGKWYMNIFEVDGGSTNFANGVLPAWEDGNGEYIIYMLDNGLARGEYYTYDTLNYFVTGEWDLLSHDTIYLNMDQFVNGKFLVELVDKENMILTSNANDIEFFNMGVVKSVLRVSRGSATGGESTIP